MSKGAPNSPVRLLCVAGPEATLLQKFLKAADAFDAKHNVSPEAARRQLRKEGLITATGRPTKRYGG